MQEVGCGAHYNTVNFFGQLKHLPFPCWHLCVNDAGSCPYGSSSIHTCSIEHSRGTIFHGCSACLKGALVCFSANVTNVIISETEKKQDTRAPTHTDSQICNPLNASCGCVKGLTSALSVNFHSRAYLLLMNTATC